MIEQVSNTCNCPGQFHRTERLSGYFALQEEIANEGDDVRPLDLHGVQELLEKHTGLVQVGYC